MGEYLLVTKAEIILPDGDRIPVRSLGVSMEKPEPERKPMYALKETDQNRFIKSFSGTISTTSKPGKAKHFDSISDLLSWIQRASKRAGKTKNNLTIVKLQPKLDVHPLEENE